MFFYHLNQTFRLIFNATILRVIVFTYSAIYSDFSFRILFDYYIYKYIVNFITFTILFYEEKYDQIGNLSRKIVVFNINLNLVHPEGLEPSIIVPKTIVISTSLWVQIMIFAFKLYHKFCIVCKFSLLYIWTGKTKFSKKHFIGCFFLL